MKVQVLKQGIQPLDSLVGSSLSFGHPHDVSLFSTSPGSQMDTWIHPSLSRNRQNSMGVFCQPLRVDSRGGIEHSGAVCKESLCFSNSRQIWVLGSSLGGSGT